MPREYIIGYHKAPVWVDCLLVVKCTLRNLTYSNVFVGEGKRQVNTHVRANLDFHLISDSVINVLHVNVAEMSKYGKVAFQYQFQDL